MNKARFVPALLVLACIALAAVLFYAYAAAPASAARQFDGCKFSKSPPACHQRVYWKREWAKVPAHGKRYVHQLGFCESEAHGKYRANTGNGFFGRVQWTLRTGWAAGFRVRPDLASPLEQDVRTWRWRLRSDPFNEWPECHRKVLAGRYASVT